MGNKETKVDVSSHLNGEIGFESLDKIFEQYKENDNKTIPRELGLHFIVSVWKHYKVHLDSVNLIIKYKIHSCFIIAILLIG